MKSVSRRLVLVCVLGMALFLAGCIPEANRERGGDSGGDIGNWSHPVRMHGDEDPTERMYYQTPSMGRGIERSRDAGTVEPES
jgi:hypothetical protein